MEQHAQIDIKWDNSLGSYWDQFSEDYNWDNSISLYLSDKTEDIW